jgi:ATP-binding cassette subfamily F protein 2
VWLEEYLKRYDKILVIVSHSIDFMNGVCTNIMHLTSKKGEHCKVPRHRALVTYFFLELQFYSGNYDQYVKTREENEANQMKQYAKQQEEIRHIKEFIASCGTYANLVCTAFFPKSKGYLYTLLLTAMPGEAGEVAAEATRQNGR